MRQTQSSVWVGSLDFRRLKNSTAPGTEKRGGLWAAGLICVLLSSLWATSATPQSIDPNLWGANGNVAAVARSGNSLYIGGSFNIVGPSSGGGISLARATGEPLGGYPKVAGVVRTVIPDGSGGWYVGGAFTGIGGQSRTNVAHILAGGEVSGWNPGIDGEVRALAIAGRRLYVGGIFGSVGGRARANVASIDALTGEVLDWHPDADAGVYSLALGRGVVFVGGDFAVLGGQTRSSLGAVDVATGIATGWNPSVGFEGTPGKVRALALTGDTLYVGGDFISVGAQARHRAAAVDVGSGLATGWDPDVTAPIDPIYGDPIVEALAIHGSSIFVGGRFEEIGGQVRSGFAELDRVTGVVSGWYPLSAGVEIPALAVQDSSLFLCGGFTTIAGLPRRYCAELNLRTGLPTSFSPRPDVPVEAMAVGGAGVYVGGRFSSFGPLWQSRRGLAALDLTTGALKDWDPNPDGYTIQALTVTHGKVYVGGSFRNIGGRARSGLAALDTLTGAATEWNPSANSVVGSLAVGGDTLYAGGYFTTMGGQPRGRLASFDLTSGAMTSWNPNAASDVYGLTVNGNTVYVAGFFWTIGGLTRKGIAAVDAASGSVLNWNPQSDNWCTAVAVVGETVFVAGNYNTIGGQPRSNLAALDRVTGQALGWTANANDGALTLAVLHDTLFVGGGFTAIGGQSRSGLAALDMNTGAVLPWSPDLSSFEWWGTRGAGAGTFALAGSTLYFGGGFWRTGNLLAGCVAAVSFSSSPLPPGAGARMLAMSVPRPNPVHSSTTIRLVLPSAALVTLSVFDVQGRRVATVLDHVVLAAGPSEAVLHVDGWRNGFYFCRLDAAGASATRKFLVVR